MVTIKENSHWHWLNACIPIASWHIMSLCIYIKLNIAHHSCITNDLWCVYGHRLPVYLKCLTWSDCFVLNIIIYSGCVYQIPEILHCWIQRSQKHIHNFPFHCKHSVTHFYFSVCKRTVLTLRQCNVKINDGEALHWIKLMEDYSTNNHQSQMMITEDYGKGTQNRKMKVTQWLSLKQQQALNHKNRPIWRQGSRLTFFTRRAVAPDWILRAQAEHFVAHLKSASNAIILISP